MGNLSNTFTFRPILIRASKDSHCTRDILVSPFMTLFQLHKFILIVFDLDESSIEYHHFNLLNQLESVETFYEIIDHQEIDGFITPVAPGVYIGKYYYLIVIVYTNNKQSIRIHMNHYPCFRFINHYTTI